MMIAEGGRSQSVYYRYSELTPLIPAYTIQRPTGYRTEDIPLLSIRVLQRLNNVFRPSTCIELWAGTLGFGHIEDFRLSTAITIRFVTW